MKSIWWEQMTNANLLVERVCNTALDEKHLIIDVPEYLPWKEELHAIIKEEIREKSADRQVEFVYPNGAEPGEILLQKYCKKEKRNEYRPGIGYAEFLAAQQDIVLNDRFVWVIINDGKEQERWANFVSEYAKVKRKNNNRGAVFILEMNNRLENTKKKGLKNCSYADLISPFDSFVFNMICVSTLNESKQVKQYLSELASNILEDNIELSSFCVHEAYYKNFLTNPYGTICSIIDNEIRSDGNDFLLDISEDEVNRRIWNTQIKIVFPLIEEYRRGFVEKHKPEIEKVLPYENSFNEVYSEPGEVEIGTLHLLASTNRISVTDIELNRLNEYKKTRNKLAHLVLLSYEEVLSIVRG